MLKICQGIHFKKTFFPEFFSANGFATDIFLPQITPINTNDELKPQCVLWLIRDISSVRSV